MLEGHPKGFGTPQSLAPIAAGGRWKESTHKVRGIYTVYCTVYFSELNQPIFEVI